MARQLVDGVWLLELGLVAPLASNAYLVDDARTAVGTRPGGGDGDAAVTLVDTGLPWNWPSIATELADAGYETSDLDRILLTHYDLDHVGGLRALRSAYDGPIFLGRADYDLARGATQPPLVHHKGLFHRIARRLVTFPDGLAVEPVDDGDRMGSFTAYITPGHNPGHTVYVHDAGVAFLGDLVWAEDGVLTRPIRFDSYDVAQIEESVRAFVERCPSFEVAAVAHGSPIESGGHAALAALADRFGLSERPIE